MAFDTGIIAHLRCEQDEFVQIAEMGFAVCQLQCWNPGLYTKESAEEIAKKSKAAGVRITTLWTGWTGKTIWDFISGPSTLGIVPPQMRAQRAKELKQGAD